MNFTTVPQIQQHYHQLPANLSNSTTLPSASSKSFSFYLKHFPRKFELQFIRAQSKA